jgi:hypothetical protein
MIIAEASRRICSSRGQQSSKPGKFIFKFTFLILRGANFHNNFILKFQNEQNSIIFHFFLNTQKFLMQYIYNH